MFYQKGHRKEAAKSVFKPNKRLTESNGIVESYQQVVMGKTSQVTEDQSSTDTSEVGLRKTSLLKALKRIPEAELTSTDEELIRLLSGV